MRLLRLIFLPALLLLIARADGLNADSSFTRPIAPGVTYTSMRRDAGPWEIRLLRISREEASARLDTALAHGRIRGVETLSSTIGRETREDDRVVAATNADFFVMGGHPSAGTLCGITVGRGELIMVERGRMGFLLGEDGAPHIGAFRTVITLVTPHGAITPAGVNHDPPHSAACVCTSAWGWDKPGGGVVARMDNLPLRLNGHWQGVVTQIVPPEEGHVIRDDEILIRSGGEANAVLGKLTAGDAIELKIKTPGLDQPIELAVGGGPELMRDGGIIPGPNPTAPRHPRTAIGYNDREIILVTVDGRQPGWSVGMRLRELGELMRDLGCTDALNLDGGGSTTAWVRGQVVNRPSDGGQRRIANALLVRSRAPTGPLAKLSISPTAIVALSGARIPLRVWPTDRWYNPIEGEPNPVRATIVPGGAANAGFTASFADGALLVRGDPGEATVRIHHLTNRAVFIDMPLRIANQAARVVVTPPIAQLCPGETARFTAEGIADDGAALWLPQDAIRWSAGAGVEDLGGGAFKADLPGARTVIKAEMGNTTGSATLAVAEDVAVEGFEGDAAIRFTKYPDTDAISGSLETIAADAPEGERYCRLTYNLGEPSGTRAAYIRVDRPVGAGLKMSLLVRGGSGSGSAPWLRAAIVDGNGTRQTRTLAAAVDWGDQWRRVELRLPDGLKPPITWQSVYVVATAGKTSEGHVDIDALRVMRIAE